MKTIPFSGKILVLGAGGVSQCTLPLLLKHIEMPKENIIVMDMLDKREILAPVLDQGVQFVQEELQQETMGEQLSKYVGSGDLILDLAWNIDCCDILQWCHDHNVLYLNTSVELWDPSYTDKTPMTDRTLYVRHMAMRKMIAGWDDPKKTTAIVEHGANPGLVSHFTKMALTDIAKKFLDEKQDDSRSEKIAQALSKKEYNTLAHLLGVKVIHISEIDTQITNQHREPDEFVNTWSVMGFHEEGIAPAEMGWGTHEQELPEGAHTHSGGPENQICLDSFGINTRVRSRVPSQDIYGMVVRHGEAFTICDSLTVWENDKPVYRPTVHYAYNSCLESLKSLEHLRSQNYAVPEKTRIMENEILPGGVDELGVLLMGHDFKSWWTGTILSIDETRELVPGQNATTLQVAASALGGVMWMIQNPHEGVLVPDQLPHEEIMEVAAPYLGAIPSIPIDWTPVPVGDDYSSDDIETWQFKNFLMPEEEVSPLLNRDDECVSEHNEESLSLA